MEASEFLRAMIIVMVIGLAVVAIGATILLLAFRTYGEERTGAKRLGLVAGLLAFVFICCGALYFFAG